MTASATNGGEGTRIAEWTQRAGAAARALSNLFSWPPRSGPAPTAVARDRAGDDTAKSSEKLLDLRDMEMFRKRRDKTLAKLEACFERRSVKAGERLFARGEMGDELFLIRRGAVRMVQPLKEREDQHLATFKRGDFVGEMAFLDREPRPADAYAEEDCELFVLSRAAFDAFAVRHRKAAMGLVVGLARSLSLRLRCAAAGLRRLEDA